MDKFLKEDEIINVLKNSGVPFDPGTKGGPVLYCKDGKRYCYKGEGHTLFLGATGRGKSQFGIKPAIRSMIEGGESVVIVDPKGEHTAYVQSLIERELVPDGARIYVLDLRHPSESIGYNPLAFPAALAMRDDAESLDLSDQSVADIVNTIVPYQPKNDEQFWDENARSIVSGLIHLFLKMSNEENLATISDLQYITNCGNIRKAVPVYNALYKCFGEGDGVIYNELANILSSGEDYHGNVYNDTKSIINAKLSAYAKSKGIVEFMCNNDFCIDDLDCTCQNIIILIKPDSSNAYDNIAGAFMTQLSQNFVNKADLNFEGRLPVRVNFILEELGNVGKSIPNLPQLMTAGRSRNIRMTLVLQDYTQLDKLYGLETRTILNNIGVTVVYGSEDITTLNLLSELCGTYYPTGSNSPVNVLQPGDIREMRVGQALVLISGTRCFVSNLFEIRKPSKEALDTTQYLIHCPGTSRAADTHVIEFLTNALCFGLEDVLKRLSEYEHDRIRMSDTIPPDMTYKIVIDDNKLSKTDCGYRKFYACLWSMRLHFNEISESKILDFFATAENRGGSYRSESRNSDISNLDFWHMRFLKDAFRWLGISHAVHCKANISKSSYFQ